MEIWNTASLLSASFSSFLLINFSGLHDNSKIKYLRDHSSKSNLLLKKLKNMFVGFINVYRSGLYVVHLCTLVCIENILLCTETLVRWDNIY